jgi:tetratricopeptide (TPR) repeat protein
VVYRLAARHDEEKAERALADEAPGGGPAAEFFSAFVHALTGKRDEAIRLLGSVTDGAPTHSVTRYLAFRRRARLRFDGGDFAGAHRDLIAMQGMGDRSLTVRARIAVVALRLGDEAWAQQAFADLRDEVRRLDTVDAWLELCGACRDEGPWHDPLSADAVERHDDAIAVLTERVRSLCNRHEIDAALEIVRRAESLGAEPADLGPMHYMCGCAFWDLHRHEEAVLEFNRCLDLDPNWPRAVWRRAFSLRELQRFEEALEDQRELRRLIAENPYVLPRTRWPRRLALTTSQAETAFLDACLGRFEEASVELQEAEKGNRGYTEVIFPKFWALALMGRYEQALDVADVLLRGHHAEYKIRCLRALGKAEEAVALARDNLDKAHDTTWIGFAYVYAVAGERERALEVLAKYEYPWYPFDLLRAARVLCVLGDNEAALERLTRAVEKGLRLPPNMPPDPDFAQLADDPRYRKLLERTWR